MDSAEFQRSPGADADARSSGGASDRAASARAARGFRLSARASVWLTAAILGLGIAFLVGNVAVIREQLGVDIALYTERTRAWLDGDGFYLPHQLAGPYEVQMGDALYPPVAILLFAPFLVLPVVLWWLIPAGLIAYAVWRHRPAPWTWPLIALCLVWPGSLRVLIYGNPTLWAAAFVAAGTVWRWPAALVAFKPTLLPFALFGIRDRRFWAVAAAGAIASLAFWSMNLDYFTVVTNARGNLVYVFDSVPVVLIPVVAWLGRRHAANPAPEASQGGMALGPEP